MRYSVLGIVVTGVLVYLGVEARPFERGEFFSSTPYRT